MKALDAFSRADCDQMRDDESVASEPDCRLRLGIRASQPEAIPHLAKGLPNEELGKITGPYSKQNIPTHAPTFPLAN